MSRQGFTAFYLDLNLTGGFSLFCNERSEYSYIGLSDFFWFFFGKISRFDL